MIEVFGDDIATWNNGRWKLEVLKGNSLVQPTDEDPDIRIDIKSLGSLFTGMRRARELISWELIEGAEDAVARVDRIFETRHAPHCPDHY